MTRKRNRNPERPRRSLVLVQGWHVRRIQSPRCGRDRGIDRPDSGRVEIFGQSLALETASERAAFLDSACQGDAALRQRVERLLAAYPNAQSLLESPAALNETTAAADMNARYRRMEATSEVVVLRHLGPVAEVAQRIQQSNLNGDLSNRLPGLRRRVTSYRLNARVILTAVKGTV